MDRGFYSQNSTPLNHTYVLDGLWSIPREDTIRRELEKERIRAEILAEEVERRRVLEEEVRRELEIELQMTAVSRIPPSLLLGQPLVATHRYQFPPVSSRIAMPLPERFDGGGRHRRDIVEFEAIPFRRSPLSPKIKPFNVNQSNGDKNKKEMIGLGKPSGSKRKAPSSPPLKKEDFSCKICHVSVTSARGLEQHLSGKKHSAKMAGMKPSSKKIKKQLKKGKKHQKRC